METLNESSIPCKTHDATCVYHACMTDHCQKENVVSNGISWGPGKCEITKNPGKEAETKWTK
jgi:hypothetical protein